MKERIAEGLGRAGTSNTLKLCSYNSVLGVIAFFSTGAIRQFCAFAIVVLVAHWFLVHTFFVTVLSIDIQRLEVRAVTFLGDVRLTHASVPTASRTSPPGSLPCSVSYTRTSEAQRQAVTIELGTPRGGPLHDVPGACWQEHQSRVGEFFSFSTHLPSRFILPIYILFPHHTPF